MSVMVGALVWRCAGRRQIRWIPLRVFGTGENRYFNTVRPARDEPRSKARSAFRRATRYTLPQTRSLRFVRLQHANTMERHNNRATAPGEDGFAPAPQWQDSWRRRDDHRNSCTQ